VCRCRRRAHVAVQREDSADFAGYFAEFALLELALVVVAEWEAKRYLHLPRYFVEWAR